MKAATADLKMKQERKKQSNEVDSMKLELIVVYPEDKMEEFLDK